MVHAWQGTCEPLAMTDQDDEAHLAAVEAMLVAEGMAEAAELLREADADVQETGYDNWNGGTRLYTVFLWIDPASYGRLGSKRKTVEEQITARVKAVYERGDNCWFWDASWSKLSFEARAQRTAT
jgi:hypothetical protein